MKERLDQADVCSDSGRGEGKPCVWQQYSKRQVRFQIVSRRWAKLRASHTCKLPYKATSFFPAEQFHLPPLLLLKHFTVFGYRPPKTINSLLGPLFSAIPPITNNKKCRPISSTGTLAVQDGTLLSHRGQREKRRQRQVAYETSFKVRRDVIIRRRIHCPF